MARIAGIDLPNKKRIEIGLTYIYGIGKSKAGEILKKTGVNPDIRVKDLSEEDAVKIRQYISDNVTVEGELRTKVALDIKRLVEINCYKGKRHRLGLPVRGQKTKTNAKTRKKQKRGRAKTKGGK